MGAIGHWNVDICLHFLVKYFRGQLAGGRCQVARCYTLPYNAYNKKNLTLQSYSKEETLLRERKRVGSFGITSYDVDIQAGKH